MRLYVNNFNLLSWPKALCADAVRLGLTPVIVDNGSTYAPLLQWYGACPWRVVRLSQNLGSLAPWRAGIVDADGDKEYAVTDPDLDLSGVPDDVLARLCDALDTHPWALKVGLSLEIDDLPESFPLRREVQTWERRFWSEPLPDGNFRAPIDTTFAVYRRTRMQTLSTEPAVRLGRPHTARHLPWYVTRETLTEEFEQYLRTTTAQTHWSIMLRQRLGVLGPESDFTPPSEHCPRPELWHSTDSESSEIEVSEFLAGLARLIQPELVVETGTGLGATSARIGRALVANGHGKLITFEPVHDIAEAAKSACLGLPIEIREHRAEGWRPNERIDLCFFDAGDIAGRATNFLHWRPWLHFVVFHDTAPHHPLRGPLNDLRVKGVLELIHFPTPRGLTIGRAT